MSLSQFGIQKWSYPAVSEFTPITRKVDTMSKADDPIRGSLRIPRGFD